MLILSVGMPRAGSGWYYNLTHDLIVSSGGQDARQVRAPLSLAGFADRSELQHWRTDPAPVKRRSDPFDSGEYLRN